MSKNYSYEGTVKLIGETQSFGANNFQKREIVLISDDENYPQHVKFEFSKDLVTKLDEFKVGDYVKIMFSINGRPWEDKHFVNLNGFAIAHTKPEEKVVTPVTVESAEFPVEEGEDDLPF